MATSTGSARFDDIVRSERYFTATLLPAILLQLPKGLTGFLALVDQKAASGPGKPTERDAAGEPRARAGGPASWAPERVEIITEFHIARDLDFVARRKSAAESPADESERRDAPDLVIVLDDELVVCEGKFFDAFTPSRLDAQLFSQRKQVRYLFADRPALRAYRHVAILPKQLTIAPDCDIVLTWDEIALLSAQILGPDHYATSRLKGAAEWYRQLIGGEPPGSGPRNYDGILPLDEVLLLCQTSGEAIQVGHTGGGPDLLSRPLEYLEAKPWKWRNRETNPGTAIPKNWIPAHEFVAKIAQRRAAVR